ncbi:MAG: RagB/SusD family nutrient uptake outer membrane protein [Bacteroidales bacterium]
MKTKYILFKSIILLLLFAGISCQDLTESPAGISTSQNFYATPDQCEAALTASMNDLFNTWGGYQNIFGLFPDGHHEWETLSIGSDFAADYWRAHYSAIKNINAVLKAIKNGNLSTYDPVLVADLEGQAKFLRAFNYFTLVRLWGKIPYITEDTPDPVNIPLTPESRMEIAQVYDNIEADLTFAAENMNDYDGSVPARPCLWTAKSLLAKVYLTRATYPLNETANYDKAMDMADDVINNGPYSLVSNVEDVFSTSNKNNSEMIFCFQTTPDDPWMPGIAVAPEEWGGWSSGPVYIPFAESYPEQPRKHVYIMLDWASDLYDLENSPVMHYTESGSGVPWMGKYNYPNIAYDEIEGMSVLNQPLLRFSDVLLIYAEAANMVNGGPTQLAVDRLNLIIDRANEGTGVEERADISMTQDSFDKKVIDERSYELCFENDRIFDVYRKRLLQEIFDESILIDYNEEDYLLPIPSFDATFIGQNPGYEK